MGRRRDKERVSITTDLKLWGYVHVAASADDLYDDLAAVLLHSAVRAVQERGVFHLALSGGSTPEPFYVRLVIDPRYRAIPWQATHLWQVDERRVPEDDVRSNFRMIRETLVDHVPVRGRQVHAMPVLLEDPAGAYEEELGRVFAPSGAGGEASGPRFQSIPRLDFVLLGVGEDGHTASLFPHSPALEEEQRWVAVNQGPAVKPPPRVTMTYPLLNAARQIAVLATGAAKAAILRRIDRQMRTAGPDPRALPITGIRPIDGEQRWFLDGPAASAPLPPPPEEGEGGGVLAAG